MYYIYCYTNKINQHKYVGQTNNYQRRIREHKSCAFNPKASSYNDLIHKKIREYGENNFQITILEHLYTEEIKIVKERERFWIKELNTFCGNGYGYNQDLGGGRRGYSSILTQEELKEIKSLIKNGTSYYEIEKKYNISTSFISSINNGIYFKDDNETYPLFKYYKNNEDYDELIDLLLNSDYSLTKIAEMLQMGHSTVKKINEGKMRKGLYPTYPIRSKSVYEIKADKVKDLLKYSKLDFNEIAKRANVSLATVQRVNKGESFNDKNCCYPLRTCNDYPKLD